jgi:hypothetical protein
MRYDIKPYSLEQALKLGVIIYPSDNPKYKIEMYDEKDGMFLGYGGASGYSDYPTYIETHGLEYANKRRDAYWKRHRKNACKEGSKGWYVARILW